MRLIDSERRTGYGRGAGYLGEKRVVVHHLPDVLAHHHPQQLQREGSDRGDRVPPSQPCCSHVTALEPVDCLRAKKRTQL